MTPHGACCGPVRPTCSTMSNNSRVLHQYVSMSYATRGESWSLVGSFPPNQLFTSWLSTEPSQRPRACRSIRKTLIVSACHPMTACVSASALQPGPFLPRYSERYTNEYKIKTFSGPHLFSASTSPLARKDTSNACTLCLGATNSSLTLPLVQPRWRQAGGDLTSRPGCHVSETSDYDARARLAGLQCAVYGGWTENVLCPMTTTTA